jgi:phosphoinositide-3-kinase regulatory subunit 4
MGNKLARTTQASASEYYLHDLPSTCNLVLKEPLGGGRFLKSVLCIHDEGLVVVKVYFKRGEFPDLKVQYILSFFSIIRETLVISMMRIGSNAWLILYFFCPKTRDFFHPRY